MIRAIGKATVNLQKHRKCRGETLAILFFETSNGDLVVFSGLQRVDWRFPISSCGKQPEALYEVLLSTNLERFSRRALLLALFE